MEIKKTVPPEAIYQLVREDYEAVAEWYDNKYDASREFAFQLHDFMNALPTNPKVLDIGAGTGKESLLLSKKSRVTAFDLSEAMLKRLKKLHPKIETKIGNMINLSFPENDFDGIWSCRSIIHIPYSDLERTLGGFNRVLKQGGTLGLIFLTPEEIGKEIVEEFLPETEAKIEGLTYYRNLYSSDLMQSLLNKVGFEIQNQMECKDMDNETLKYFRAIKKNI